MIRPHRILSMLRSWSWLAFGVALIAALYFVGLVWIGTTAGTRPYDIYGYYSPNLSYFLQRLAHGGSGLLWNPFQNCGQPFFGIGSTGVLSPTNLFALFLSTDNALSAVTVMNLTIAGVSAYALARELGIGRIGALCGALAFELGNTSIDLNTWVPMNGGAYVWLPAMMLGCERVLRAPSLRRGLQLAAIVALALLPGSPQPVLYAYQLIALRLLWVIGGREVVRLRATLGALAVGLVLPPLLVAVQFFPAIEMARLSVRNAPLSLSDLAGLTGRFPDWAGMREAVGRRQEINNPFLLLPFVVASWSLVASATRRQALFYLTAGLIFFALGFGTNGPLYDWYLRLPFGRTFREPARFLWVTGFCLAMLTALGLEAIRRRDSRGWAWRRGLAFAIATILAVAGFRVLSLTELRPTEWALVGIAAAGGILAASLPAAPRWPALVAAGTVVFNLAGFALPALPAPLAALAVRRIPFRRPLPSGDVLHAHREFFAQLRTRMNPQERVYLAYPYAQFSLVAKSAQVFGVPAIQDYEPQPTRRSAEYAVMLRANRPMRSLNDYYYRLPEGPLMIDAVRRRLLDLGAAHYVVVDATIDTTSRVRPPLPLLFTSGDDTVRVYENTRALPRAYYVPRLEVVGEPHDLLQRLAHGSDDPLQVALAESRPASGFTGVPGNDRRGSVAFVLDDPEHVVLRVSAPERGFLQLSDQYFPGWRATVNGAPSQILPANFLFRVVEVPAGESIVQFRYAPTSLRVGALVSAVTLLATILLLWRSNPQRRAERPH
jgi:hypothetical protein